MTEAAVLIRLHVKPECLAACRAHTLTLVNATRSEPHCQSIQLLHRPEEPRLLLMVQHWDDKAYYLSDAHQHSAHMQSFFDATQAMIADVGVEMLEPVDEAFLTQVHDDAA